MSGLHQHGEGRTSFSPYLTTAARSKLEPQPYRALHHPGQSSVLESTHKGRARCFLLSSASAREGPALTSVRTPGQDADEADRAGRIARCPVAFWLPPFAERDRSEIRAERRNAGEEDNPASSTRSMLELPLLQGIDACEMYCV